MPPTNIFDHTMDVLKNWDSDHRLDQVAAMHSSVLLEAYEGRIVHRETNGTFQMGCKADKVPYVLLNDSKAYGSVATLQARNPNSGWQGYGKMNRVALCCLMPYEIATTEFLAEGGGRPAYDIDQYLTARPGDTVANQAEGGLLTNVVPGTTEAVLPNGRSGTADNRQTICGIVSHKPRTLQNMQTVLQFYTAYFPGTATAAAAVP
jgi:hypothetical protein